MFMVGNTLLFDAHEQTASFAPHVSFTMPKKRNTKIRTTEVVMQFIPFRLQS